MSGARPVRRVAVAAPALPAAATEWLEQEAAASVRRYGTLAAVPLGEVDVLWVDGPMLPPSHEALDAWLAAGGRLLVTGAWADAAASDARATELVACGTHPLFAGCQRQLVLPRAVAIHPLGAPDAWPAGVVAVACRDGVVRRDRAVVRETAVGDGGTTHLGLDVAAVLDDAGVRTVLLNALLGDAIPHRERAAPAPHWPRPGALAVHDASLPLPRFPDLGDFWLADVAAPIAAARRLRLETDGTMPHATLRACWAAGVRMLDQIAVHLGGVRAEAAVRQRLLPALELPGLVWELSADAAASLAVDWVTDVAPAPPLPSGSYGDLRFNVNESGRRLWIGSAAGPQLAVEILEGRVTVLEPLGGAAGPAVRVTCEGRGTLRFVLAAAADSAELERVLAGLGRRGVEGLRGQHKLHRRLVAEHAVAIEVPEPALAERFERAKERLDAMLLDLGGAGRGLLPGTPREPMRVVEAVPAALALLAAGSREGPRELLRLLADHVDPAGRAAAAVTFSGFAERDGAAAARALGLLVRGWWAWTGDREQLERRAAALERALGAPLPALLAPRHDAETSSPSPWDLPGDSADVATIAAEVQGRWALRPDAPAGALRLHPTFPAAWPRMALRRLRLGSSVLDLELRRRFGRVTATVHRTQGPRVQVTLGLAGPPPALLTVDDEPLGGAVARFTADGRHDVVFAW